MRRLFRLSFGHVLCLCLFCGVTAGTVAANLLGAEVLEVMSGRSVAGQLAGSAIWPQLSNALDQGMKTDLWRYVLHKRLTEFGLAALVGMTPFSALGFSGIVFAGGLGGGFLLSVVTLQNGISGIFVFLLIVFPHWLFYLPVWTVLALKSEEGLEQMRFRLWMLLAAAVFAGIFLEIFINPCFWRL